VTATVLRKFWLPWGAKFFDFAVPASPYIDVRITTETQVGPEAGEHHNRTTSAASVRPVHLHPVSGCWQCQCALRSTGRINGIGGVGAAGGASVELADCNVALIAASLQLRRRLGPLACMVRCRRSGYLRDLLEHMRWIHRPDDLDVTEGRPARRLEGEYPRPSTVLAVVAIRTLPAAMPAERPGPDSTARRPRGLSGGSRGGEPALFDTSRPDETFTMSPSKEG
jgi:hypothetical protein